uniref:Uncharacterized protein n=1 Tax=Glossina pallidipes TaxID=7398 RepID=A0A1B0AH74_GLOPL
MIRHNDGTAIIINIVIPIPTGPTMLVLAALPLAVVLTSIASWLCSILIVLHLQVSGATHRPFMHLDSQIGSQAPVEFSSLHLHVNGAIQWPFSHAGSQIGLHVWVEFSKRNPKLHSHFPGALQTPPWHFGSHMGSQIFANSPLLYPRSHSQMPGEMQ